MRKALSIPFLLCALAMYPSVGRGAERQLDAAQIRRAVVGRPVRIVTATAKTQTLYLEKGGGVTGQGKSKGKWSIANGELCLDIVGLSGPICVTVVERSQIERHLLLFTSAGEPFGEMLFPKEQ